MNKLSLCVLLSALVGIVACGETDKSDPQPLPQPKEDVAKKPSELIQGEWSIVLNDEEQRQVEVLQFALKDPAPTEAEMTDMKLSEDEKMMVALMAAAKAQDPSDPKVKEMQAAAEGLAKATVTITADTMTFKAGPVTEDSSYTVASQTDKSVSIVTKGDAGPDGAPSEGDKATITLKDADTIEMVDAADATQKQTFTRKK